MSDAPQVLKLEQCLLRHPFTRRWPAAQALCGAACRMHRCNSPGPAFQELRTEMGNSFTLWMWLEWVGPREGRGFSLLPAQPLTWGKGLFALWVYLEPREGCIIGAKLMFAEWVNEWMNEWPLHHGWLGLELGLMRAVSSPRKSLLEKGVRVSPGCAMSTEEKQSVIYSGGIPTRYPQGNLVFYGVLRKQVPFLSGNVCCCLCSLYWEEGQCLSLFHTHTHF